MRGAWTKLPVLLALAGAAHAQPGASDDLLLKLVAGLPVAEWPATLSLPPAWTQAFADDLAASGKDFRERARCLSLRGAEPALAAQSLQALAELGARRRAGSEQPGDSAALRRTLAARFAGQSALATAVWEPGERIEGGAMTVDVFGNLDRCSGAFVGLFHTHPGRPASKHAAVPSDGDFRRAMRPRGPSIEIVGDLSGGLCVLLKPEANTIRNVARLAGKRSETAERALDAEVLTLLNGFGLAGMADVLASEKPMAWSAGGGDGLTGDWARSAVVMTRTAADLGAALYCGPLGEPLGRLPVTQRPVPLQANAGITALTKAMAVVMAFHEQPQNPEVPFLLNGELDAGYRAYLRAAANRIYGGDPHPLREPLLQALATPQGPPTDLVLAFEYERLYLVGVLNARERPVLGASFLRTQDIRRVFSGDKLALDHERNYEIQLLTEPAQRPLVAVHKVDRETFVPGRGPSMEGRVLARIVPASGHLRLGLDSGRTRIDEQGRSRVVEQNIETVVLPEPAR